MTPLRRRWTWATLAVVLAVAAVVGWVRVTGDPYGELVTDPASVDGTWEAVEVWGDYDPSDGIYVGVHGDRWQIGIGDGCNQLIGYLDIAPDGGLDVSLPAQTGRPQMMCHGWDHTENLAVVEAAGSIWLDGETVRLVHPDGWVLATYQRDEDQ